MPKATEIWGSDKVTPEPCILRVEQSLNVVIEPPSWKLAINHDLCLVLSGSVELEYLGNECGTRLGKYTQR